MLGEMLSHGSGKHSSNDSILVALIFCLFPKVSCDWPWLLLGLLQSGPHVVCEHRRAISAKLLGTDNESLNRDSSDITIKCKKVFLKELEDCKAAGTCPIKLYVFLLQWRSQLPFDTQEVEGMNNVLQEMTRRAGHLQLALASARMCLKKGPEVAARTCLALDQEVKKVMASSEYATKFLTVNAVGKPPLAAPVLDEISRDPAFRYAKGFMPAIREKFKHKSGVKHLWVLGGQLVEKSTDPQPAFVVACPYATKFYVATGQVQGDTFTLTKPFAIKSIQQELGQLMHEVAPKTIKLQSFAIEWKTSLYEAKVDFASRVGARLRWKKPCARKTTATTSPPEPESRPVQGL